MSKWKSEAISLALTTDLSWRAIARDLGKSKSTVSDLLRKLLRKVWLLTLYQ